MLVAALGLSLVPAVGAQGAPSLSSVLDDADAFDQALAAARDADAGSDPIVVFAEVYAAAVGDVSVEALVHLLGQSSMSGVLPPVHDETVAASKAAGPPATSAAALFGLADVVVPTSPVDAASGDVAWPPLRRLAPASRPRAP